MVFLLVDMVAEADEVLIILEGNDALAVYLRQREEVLKDVGNSVSQTGVKVVEDHVREGLTHRIYLVLEIVS